MNFFQNILIFVAFLSLTAATHHKKAVEVSAHVNSAAHTSSAAHAKQKTSAAAAGVFSAIVESASKATKAAAQTLNKNIEIAAKAQQQALTDIAKAAQSAVDQIKDRDREVQNIQECTLKTANLLSLVSQAVVSDTQNTFCQIVDTVELTNAKVLDTLCKSTANISCAVDQACDALDAVGTTIGLAFLNNLKDAASLITVAFEKDVASIGSAVVTSLNKVTEDVAKGDAASAKQILGGNAAASQAAVKYSSKISALDLGLKTHL